MPVVKDVIDTLALIEKIHKSKNDDYAGDRRPFFNFEFSAALMGNFNDPQDKAFVNLIGTKLARSVVLLDKQAQPNNESIDDSFLDLAVYVLLWKANRKERNNESIS